LHRLAVKLDQPPLKAAIVPGRRYRPRGDRPADRAPQGQLRPARHVPRPRRRGRGRGLYGAEHWARALEVDLIASAAGLLPQIGLVPYAASKHAAAGFAEGLAVTCGDKSSGVSCLCPIGVATATHEAGLEAAGDQALGARFLVLPHPEVLDFYRRKGTDYDGRIRSMQRLQARRQDG
jgi:NAD(P)-dependent dehydrogenase (short-subunit alcohol dehydrogenase family)